MRSPTDKTAADRRKAAQSGVAKSTPSTPAADAGRMGAPKAKPRSVAHAMVDALEDILEWERASERALRVAQATTDSDLRKN
jgi:hypothetical protein